MVGSKTSLSLSRVRIKPCDLRLQKTKVSIYRTVDRGTVGPWDRGPWDRGTVGPWVHGMRTIGIFVGKLLYCEFHKLSTQKVSLAKQKFSTCTHIVQM